LAAAPAKPKPPRRKARDVIKALGRPRVGVMLALGISSGLPFALVGATLTFWLAQRKIDVTTIGLTSAIGFAYGFKFLWGPFVDRLPLPLIGRLGRRRSWMLLTQVIVGLAFVGMAMVDPKANMALFVVVAIAAAVGSAFQDTVIDAWRIEIAADADELGLLTAANTLGYKIALTFTEAIILSVAKRIDWPASYIICGAAMSIGFVAAILAREPVAADMVMERKEAAALRGPKAAALYVFDAVVGPIIAFFRAHGVFMAALMLAMITLYHLSDYGRGAMVGPYYTALKIDNDTIAWVRLALGTPASFVGIALGGLCALRIGNVPTLILGAILQPIAVAFFAPLGFHGGDFALVSLGAVKITAFEAAMTFDSAAFGFAGVALVSYMSTLTSLGYTATQYALLTSAMAFTGKSLKTASGAIEQSMQHGDALSAFANFYLLCGLLGVPAIFMCAILAWAQLRRVRAQRPPPTAATVTS
jgi:PAT family beta-lactamase induction signal transducer AmpG